MKKHVILYMLIFAVLLSGQMLASAAPESPLGQPLRLVYFDNYPPFSYADEHLEMKGVFVDILTEVLQNQMKIPVVHQGYSWARAQLYVKNGDADGFCTVPNDERCEYSIVSTEPVFVSDYVIYTRKSHPRLDELRSARSYEELKDYTFCYYIGSGWAKKKLVPLGIDIEWTPSHENVFSMIAAGRVDLTVASREVARQHIKRLKLEDKLIELPHVFDTEAYYLCIGKHSAYRSILPEFDKHIGKMRKSGQLDRFIGKSLKDETGQ